MVSLKRFCSFFLLQLPFLFGLSLSAFAGEHVLEKLGSSGEGIGLSFAVTSGNKVAFSYLNSANNNLYYKKFNGSSWDTELVALNLNLSSNTSLVFLDAEPHIFFIDSASARLKHLFKSNDSWLTETVDSTTVASGELDASVCGVEICLSYYDSVSKNLRFAVGQSNSWQKSVVDSSSADVGYYSDILEGPDSKLYLAYYDATNRVPKLAVREGSVWEIESIEFLGHSFGLHPKVTVSDQGVIHLATSSYKSANTSHDLSVYYAKKEPSSSWSVSEVSDDYAGQVSGIILNDSGVNIAYRYHRMNEVHGNLDTVESSHLSANGLWEIDEVQEISEDNPAQINHTLAKTDYWGSLLLAYSYADQNNQNAGFAFYGPKDSDSDGIPDTRESLYGTNIFNADTDNDGVSDGDEVLIHGTNPLASDTDGRDGPGDGNPPGDFVDSDNDLISDEFELQIGTDPNNPDTDADGILDGQEITDQSNPLDRGSNMPILGTQLCSEWNGFLDNMWNILEVVNLSSDTVFASLVMYDLAGVASAPKYFSVSAGAQSDLLVHSFEEREADSFGKVCVSHSGQAGDIDGRMVYYKPNNSAHSSKQYQFAFAMPFAEGRKGKQHVTYNTFQPSYNPNDAENQVANWIQIMNLGLSDETGVLKYYDILGNLLNTQNVSIRAGERKDYSAHKFGRNKVGVVEWVPSNLEAKFQLRNVRYIYDNGSWQNSFTTAFQLEGMYGAGDLQAVPITTKGEISIIEVVNVLDQPINVEVKMYSTASGLESVMEYAVRPKESKHVIVNQYLGEDKEGLATISSNHQSSAIAVAMQYGMSSNNSLKYMYGVPAKPALGVAFKGSYNTYLEQKSELWLINTASSSQDVSLSLMRSSGEDVLLGENINLSAKSVVNLNLNNYEEVNHYGVVTLSPEINNSIIAWTMRKRAGDYTFPVPVR